MNVSEPHQNPLEKLKLSRLGETDVAGLWIASVPWPRKAVPPISLGGAPTTTLPLGPLAGAFRATAFAFDCGWWKPGPRQPFPERRG